VSRVVIGCATPKPPENGWVERGTSETVIVGCNLTIQRWYLHCTGRQWVGNGRNCSNIHDVGGEYTTYTSWILGSEVSCKWGVWRNWGVLITNYLTTKKNTIQWFIQDGHHTPLMTHIAAWL